MFPAARLAEKWFLLGLIGEDGLALAPTMVLPSNGRVGLPIVECTARGFFVFIHPSVRPD
jgi:hypothetical protein